MAFWCLLLALFVTADVFAQTPSTLLVIDAPAWVDPAKVPLPELAELGSLRQVRAAGMVRFYEGPLSLFEINEDWLKKGSSHSWHGNQVYQIARRAAGNGRVLFLPFNALRYCVAPGNAYMNSIPAFSWSERMQSEREMKAALNSLSDFIQKENVRVINLSVDPSFEANVRLESAGPFHQGRWMMKNATALWRKFLRRHPETLFVFAAGNLSKDVSSYRADPYSFIPDSSVKNAIVVVAQDKETLGIASYSDFGASGAHIAAYGGSLTSAEGNSFATARVSGRLISIFETNPHMSAASALETLYQKHSVSTPALRGGVAYERALKDDLCSGLVDR